MKTCGTCGESKPLDQFQKHPQGGQGRQSFCKVCQNDHKNRWRKDNPGKHKKQYRRDRATRRDQNLVLIREARDQGCLDCGERDHVVLQFHHRVPATKSFGVAQPSGRQPGQVAEEIAKCDVLCANCHLRRHHEMKLNPGATGLDPGTTGE